MMRAPGRPLTDVRELVVHHSKTPDGRRLDTTAIRRYHVQHNGWDDIGYHYLVERDEYGAIQVIHGRPEDRTGAHCRGHNQHTIGVCFVGDFDVTTPTDELLETAAMHLWPVMRRHGLTASDLVGDRDHHPAKTCPGSKFDLDRLRAVVNEARRARL